MKATQDWRDCVEGADIVVEASRLTEPAPLLKRLAAEGKTFASLAQTAKAA